MSVRWLEVIGTFLLCFLLDGCVLSQIPVHQYALQHGVTEPLLQTPFSFEHIILVGPVDLPVELDQPGIVSRPFGVSINASATHLWAGSLAEQISQSVVDELSILLNTGNIATYPGPRFADAAYQIEIEFQRFDGTPGKDFFTHATWTVSDIAARRIVSRQSFRNRSVINDTGYNGYIDAASQAISALSKEIALSLPDIDAPQSSP